MENKKRILFIPGIPYLADPQFFAIIPYLRDYFLIYLYTHDSYSALMGKSDKRDIERINNTFDVYDETEPFHNYAELSSIKNIQKVTRFKAYIEGVRNKLSRYKPDCIVSCSDMGISQRTAIQWAKRRKIPFIIIQSAFFEVENIQYQVKLWLSRILFNNILKIPIFRKGNLFGNESKWPHLVLWGDFFKKFYQNRKKIHLLGNPAFDKHINKSITSNIVSTKKMLICTENSHQLELMVGKSYVNTLFNMWEKMIRDYKDWIFIIKPHPAEEVGILYKKFNKFKNAKIVGNDNLYKLFSEVDVQLSVNSASSFDALVAGLPVILTNPDTNKIPNVFFDKTVVFLVKNNYELDIAIDEICSSNYYRSFNQKREKFLKERLSFIDGSSSIKVSELISNLLDRHKNLAKSFKS